MGASGAESIIRAKIPYGAIARAIQPMRRLKEKQMKPVWLLFISVVSATLGQIFFKKGVFMTGEITLKESLIGDLFRLVLNPFVFSGLVLYVISTLVWLIALSKTTLSFVFPFTALIFVLVMLSARIVFLEPIPTLRYLGIFLICLGFLLSSIA
jgi:drug/metabolite transporter (DMT)-like permease